MTVIAFDGLKIAVDNSADISGWSVLTEKGRRLSDRTVLVATGFSATCFGMMDWYEAGEDFDKWPKFQDNKDDWGQLVVFRAGELPYYYTNYPVKIPVRQMKFAWGSGREFAMGAMMAGASAERAVLITNKLSSSCGRGVTVFDLPEGLHIGIDE